MSTQPITLSEAVDTAEREKAIASPRAKGSTGGPQGAGVLWFGGWLFTIGFAKLIWWKALLGLVAWPYFLGEFLR